MYRPPAYQGNDPYIFVSYAHLDEDTVLPIIEHLTEEGFRVWYDAGIEAGTEWPEYIAERLDESDCVIAFLSRAALNSKNCKREINFALELDKNVLAVYLEDLELTRGMRMQLNSLQALYRSRHRTEEAFLCALADSQLLQNCRQPGEDGPVASPSARTEKVWDIHTVWEPEDEPDYKDFYYEKSEVYWDDAGNYDGSFVAYFAYGQFLFYKHDYDGAYKNFERSVKGCFPRAMAWLARCSKNGFGTEKNEAYAFMWEKFAAYNGDPYGMYLYAFRFLEDGNYTKDDFRKHVSILRKAAEYGSPEAMLRLGDLYGNGDYRYESLSKNLPAQKWYHQAFVAFQENANSNPEAQWYLGLCYRHGLGVEKDIAEGEKWTSKAKENGFLIDWI